MPDLDIRFVGDLTRVEILPGDIFVLQCIRQLSQEESDRLTTQLSAALDGAKVIVLDSMMKLGVIGAGDLSENL